MYNYQSFFSWCVNNNGINKFMNFKKDVESQNKMCLFVREYYKRNNFLTNIICMEETIHEVKDLHYNIKNNLRMTICELE